MQIKYIAFWLFLSFHVLSYSQETKAPVFGKGLLNLVGEDSTWSMKIGLRMQLLGMANWQNESERGLIEPEQNFLIRRSRLKFDGFAYSPKLKYKIELGLSNRDMSGASDFTGNAPRYILDAVLMWNFYRNFELWLGQTKLPGNIERVISSGNLQQVDRSLLNSRFNIDRDVGIQLRHHFYLSQKFLVREKFAFSQGEGRNVINGNLGGHQYTTRLELLPFGKFEGNDEYKGSDLRRQIKPKLMLAATFDHNQNAVKTRSNLGAYMVNDIGFYQTDINTFFMDAMFKYSGVSVMAEFAHRSADQAISVNSDGSPTGDVVLVGDAFNLQTGYLFYNNMELSARFTSLKFDNDITSMNQRNQYTIGLSKYIAGHKLKIQSDLSYLSVRNEDDELMYRLQVDIHF